MIRRLKIQNFAIIEDVELEFSPHLIIITGETGAGKSILIGALNLVLGQRADIRAIGNQTAKCVVEAEFTIKGEELKPFFESQDLDFDHEIVIRREISAQGKSRAFINDTPVNLEILQTLSAALIDVHQQFDTLDIYQVSTQLRMIDALAGNNALLGEYQQEYKKYTFDLESLRTLKDRITREEQEAEFIKFQWKELDELNLVAGEMDFLEAEQKALSHAGEIKSTAEKIHLALTEEEQSLTSMLNDLDRGLHPLGTVHQGMKSISERLNSTLAELEDISAECKNISEQIDLDPTRLAEVEERLSSLFRLCQKHRVKTVEELIGLHNQLSSRMHAASDLGEQMIALEREVKKQEVSLYGKARELHTRREKVIPGFIEKIYVLLRPLAMENTQVRIELIPVDSLNQTGLDQIEFLLATNKGGAFLPIKQIASGGELARFNLVTKSLVARAIPLPTLIFDEIDIGIGGDVALKMGRILKDLSVHHQVICITHSPQIAAKGDLHYFVYKDESTERTTAQVKKLNKTERVQAIAAMLSTNPPTAAAIKNAKELIEIV